MKKAKKAILIFLAFIGVFALVILLLFWLLFHEHTYHIKTEYGDSFTICGGGLADDYCLSDDNSDFLISLRNYYGTKDIKELCDSEYLKAYRICNADEDVIILKIKKYDTFISIYPNNKDYTLYHLNGKHGEMIKSELLSDYRLIELVLPYLDEVYHKEMQEMAKKLTSGDYKGLEQYGLTQEMINDKDSLDEKIRIMEDYLNNGGNQNERTAP